MKLPSVDYRKLKLSNLGSPEFSHLILLLGWVGYFIAFYLTETLIPSNTCHIIHCPLDDRIPFWEGFVVPYVAWYFLVAGSLVYFAFYNVDSFKKLMVYIIITQVIAVSVYILYPSRQELRPSVLPRDNICTNAVALLYAVDTNTNVFPSLHVGFSLAILSVWSKEKEISRIWKAFIALFVFLVCLSTVFIKQHSVLDVLAAVAMCLIAELLVYGRYYFSKAIFFS